MYGFPKRKHAANGGLITGPGTGTSDSIEKDVPEGTYILPADTTKKIGYGAPGYKGNPKGMQKQKPGHGWPMKGEQVPVAVSNGEMEMPPEQVHAIGAAVLDQVKAATHKPKGFGAKGFGMNKQEPPRQFFADGGLVEDEKRKAGFGMNNPARQGLTPQGVQGMAKDAASKPATGFGAPGYKGGVAASQNNPAATERQPGVLDVPAGLGRAAIGALGLPQAAVADGVRNVAAYATGGDPSTLEGGSSKYRDMATGQVKQGLAQAGGALERAQAAGREALGVQPLRNNPDPVPGGAVASAAPGAPSAPVAPATQSAAPVKGYGWNKTGIGADRQGGEIVARMGADGVPEFTNEAATPGSVASAGERPARGYGWRPKSERGGGGTFSQGEPGDAQMALERFERANQEKEKMIQASRRGGIGEGGGRVTVVRDSSRAPSVAETLRDRQDAGMAQTEALRAQTQQGAASAANQLAMDAQRMGTEQLNQQRLQQQIAEGDLGMQDRQRRADLEAMLADPNLSPEQRAQAEAAYYALNTEAKDRYMEVRGGTDVNGAKAPSQVFDRRTGQYVDAQGGEAMPAGMTLVGYKDGRPVYQDASGKRFVDG